MKIALGTVQFGLDYGVSNLGGKTSPAEVIKILDVAREYRIKVIDTAALYGNSEEALGKSLPQDYDFKIITKTIRIDSCHITATDGDRLENAFIDSLGKLNCHSVYGLMFHNADDLLSEGGEILWECLTHQKKIGKASKIGASVYTAEQIDKILSRFEIDLIQLPMNILDQRLIVGGQLAALKSRGVEIHARSAFLQGLLLMSPETMPGYFDPVKNHLKSYHEFLNRHNLTPIQAAFGFLAARDEIDVIVCGVNNHKQLIELCQANVPLPDIDFSQFAWDDPSILDPSQWIIKQ